MNELIFLTAQPSDGYFVWQVEVQITNFKKFDLERNMHVVVWYREGNKSDLDAWYKLQTKYPKVHFFFYKDEGAKVGTYIPVLRPHALKQHFKTFPELRRSIIFYHDCDIIFNYLPDFEKLMQGNICWQSDCSSYLDYSYLTKKEKEGNIPNNEAVKKMAEIGGIPVEIIESYTGKTGGAQTILRGITSKFWEDVERMSIEIIESFAYSKPNSINKKYFSSEKDGFQSWCADMWALNFAQWKRGIPTDITKDLDFSWGTDTYEKFLERPIFHNAGVASKPEPPKNLFYKGEWRVESPLGKDLILPADDTASKQYVLAIKDVIHN